MAVVAAGLAGAVSDGTRPAADLDRVARALAQAFEAGPTAATLVAALQVGTIDTCSFVASVSNVDDRVVPRLSGRICRRIVDRISRGAPLPLPNSFLDLHESFARQPDGCYC